MVLFLEPLRRKGTKVHKELLRVTWCLRAFVVQLIDSIKFTQEKNAQVLRKMIQQQLNTVLQLAK